jgi:transcriptional regulator with XRE-family HTH domain
MIMHTHGMARAKKPIPLGAAGETVRANVKQLREDQNLGYSQLSRKLHEVGRSVPDLGLRRIEAGERRVDVDDLMALAVALGVSPVTLLMPPKPSDDKHEMVVATEMVEAPGEDGGIPAGRLWQWLRADMPLPGYKGPHMKFFVDARPEWDEQSPGHARWLLKKDTDGDD